MLEIDSLAAFDRWAANPSAAAAIQGLDLLEREAVLCGLQCSGSLFLACRISPVAAGSLVMGGAIVVPDLPGRVYTVHRASLYAAEELYDSFDPDHPESFADCLDQRIYREYLAEGKSRPADLAVGMAQGLHDHSISDALYDLLAGRRVVAVMGGHGMERTDPRYGSVVRVSKALAERGYLMVSGGGPGAMEATHLGAWLAGRDPADVEAVLTGPFVRRPRGAPPGREYADDDWLVRAWRVRERWPRVSEAISVGMPTWLYGHEPPTPFATHIAKYFANSIREDGVLAVATHGVVFAPGSAGTTQEIFQDACQNHYGTMGWRSPMVLLDRAYWTETRPVWPFLRTVSEPLRYGELVSLVDEEHEVLEAIQGYEPLWYRVSDDEVIAFETELRHGLRLGRNWRFEAVEPGELAGPAVPADPRAAADWLFALGDEDWIDHARAERIFGRLLDCGPEAALAPLAHPAPLTSEAALILTWPDRTVRWRAVLLD